MATTSAVLSIHFSYRTVNTKYINFSEECADIIDSGRPKLIFCHSEHLSHVQEAVNLINLDITIITFDDSANCTSFKKFNEMYEKPVTVENFK